MAGMARVQAQRRDAAKLDESTQNTEAHGAAVENAAPLEIPATLELSAREVEAFNLKAWALWLGGNVAALALFGLAVRVAVSNALLQINAPEAAATAMVGMDPPESVIAGDKILGGYLFAFMLYMAGTCFIQSRTAARWARAALFYSGAAAAGSCLVLTALRGDSNFGSQFSMLMVTGFCTLAGFLARQSLWTAAGQSAPQTTVAHARFGQSAFGDTDDMTED